MESPFNQIALRSPFFDAGLSVFTPLSLFSASEPGAWYDPSDMSMMFQDAAGTTPVTAVEQPVSLLLDKSKSLALGSELVTNGNFTTNTTGWNASSDNDGSPTFASVSGAGLLTANNGNAGWNQGITTVIGKWYKVTATATIVSGTPTAIRVRKQDNATVNGATNSVVIVSAAGTVTGYFIATATTTYIQLQVNITTGTAAVAFDNISLVEIAGSHAYTPSTATASRPVLSARYNLLTKTEQFDDAVWTKTNSSITTNQTIAPDGTSTADLYSSDATNGGHFVFRNSSTGSADITSGVSYTWSVYLKKGNGATAPNIVQLSLTSAVFASGYANFNISNGTVGTTSNMTAAIGSVGDGWYRCSVTATATATNNLTGLGGIAFTNNNDGLGRLPSYVDATTSNVFIWGADLRVANDGVGIPTYQRVNTSTDYDTINFPMYLRFDGSDDYMLTGTITPGTDKAQVFAGVRKLSDAATAAIAELGDGATQTTGRVALYAPGSPGANYTLRAQGSGDNQRAYTTYTAPITNVVAGSLTTLAADSAAAVSGRINAIALSGTSTTSNNSTGNFGNYPLYIGRRGGSSIPFNGRLFGLIVRFGANLDNTQITNTETWMNGKTKAY